MLIFQTQHLDKMKRAYPKFHLAGHQPVRFGGQPLSRSAVLLAWLPHDKP
jgi:hypothetical protein